MIHPYKTINPLTSVFSEYNLTKQTVLFRSKHLLLYPKLTSSLHMFDHRASHSLFGINPGFIVIKSLCPSAALESLSTSTHQLPTWPNVCRTREKTR